jgi:DNA-binding MarR family transcriptional regulator
VTKEANLRRVKQALVDLQRITNSRKLHVVRAERAKVAISAVAGSVLRHVVDDGPIRPVDLAERTRMRPPALTRHLKNLEADGCIQRVPAPGDGRGALVVVTAHGRAVIRRLERAEDQILHDQLAAWSAVELEQLVGLLDRLIDDFRAPAPVGAFPSAR